MPVPGPAPLGRGVVVRRGDAVPAPWADARVVEVDEAVPAQPDAVVTALHEAWARREPLVVVLGVDADVLRTPASITAEPWRLHARFEVWLDRLHFLVWANTYDARGGIAPVWWWARKASRLGATEVAEGRLAMSCSPTAPRCGSMVGRAAGSIYAQLGAGLVHRETVDLGRLHPEPAPVPVRAALAPDQLAAVAHGAGAARIVAPAGSGKTRVLTERLRHLVVDRGIEREGVLAVAYNKKAQLELEERTADFRPRVSTLNALGYRLLADHAGRTPRVLDEREVRRLVDELVPPRRHRANTDPIAPYLEGLTAMRLGLRDPADVEAERDDVPGLAAAFEPYRRAMARAGAVDFDEQVYGAIEVLLRDGEFRRRVQAGFRHLLVDEFQDLTPAHVLLLRLLATPGLDVFGVGDDDQVIYGYIGADPAFLIDFEQLFPGAASHPLEVNYRCPTVVVDAARTLLSYNHCRVTKEIRPGPDADTDPGALAVHRHAPEIGAQRWSTSCRVGWPTRVSRRADVAVLTRVNSLLLAPHVALAGAGVPISSTLSADVLQRTGVRAALAYLRLGAHPERLKPDDLQEVLRRPSRGFPQWIGKWFRRPMSIDELRAIADRIDDVKVGAKVDRAGRRPRASSPTRSARSTTREVLAVVADQIGLGRGDVTARRLEGWAERLALDDLDALSQVADLHPDAGHVRGVAAGRARATDPDRWGHALDGPPGQGHGMGPGRRVRRDGRRPPAPPLGRRGRGAPCPPRRHHPWSPPGGGARRCDPSVAVPRRARRLRATPAAAGRGRRGALARRAGDGPPRSRAACRPRRPRRRGPRTSCARGGCSAAAPTTVPAYVVLSNAVLRAVAIRRPTTLAELAQVAGIGPTKLDLYGDEILAVLDAEHT